MNQNLKSEPMKSIEIIRSALTMLLAFAAVGVQAGQPGYYAGVHGGRNDVKDWNASVSLGAIVTLPGTVGAERAAHWGVFGGRQTENARFEVEYQWGNFDITSIQLGALQQAVAKEGDYRALMLNAYRTYDFNERFTGYAGLGIGWGEVKLPQMGFSGGCNCFPAADKSGFAYQGRIGAEWHITPRHNAFLQYTSIRLPRPASGGTPGVTYSRKSVGTISIGYRHQF